VRLGRNKALQFSNLLHVFCAFLILMAAYQLQETYAQLGWLHWLGAGIFVSLLIYQHLLVKADDLSKVNLAFFTTNGVASLILGSLVILDCLF